MLKKLRRRFICFTMTVVTILLSVVFVLVYHSTHVSLEHRSLQLMGRLWDDFRRHELDSDQPDEVRLPYFILQVDTEGNIASYNSSYFDLPNADYVTEVAQQALASPEKVGILKEQHLRYSRESSSMGVTIIFTDISNEIDTLRGLVTNCVFIGFLCLLVFLALSFLLAWWNTKPVEEAWIQQKQFVADASHELKTPLTVILTNAELLQTPQLRPETRNQCASNVLTMARQMRGLVESLLELARVDNGTLKTHFVEVELGQLVQDSALPFEPVFFEQGIGLSLKTVDGIYVNGSESHLRQVLEILLDNAQKYASEHGQVKVRLVRQGGHCLLSVSNPGNPIAKEDLENIFKRFYRVDKARNMNHSYGLGLPIARGILQVHGGKIWAESEGGINTFYVQLPCLNPGKDKLYAPQ